MRTVVPPTDHHGDPAAVLAHARSPVGALARRLDAALAEVGVVGLAVDPATDSLDLLLHAPCPATAGGVDPDPRRVLRLVRPHQVDVTLLREVPDAGDADDPDDAAVSVRLPDLGAVAAFLASVSWASTMCGGGFVTGPRPTLDEPGLRVVLDPRPSAAGLRWFAECEREEDGEPARYRIEGWVGFELMVIVDAHGRALAWETFLAGRERWWRGLLERRSPQAPDVPAPLAWRPWAGLVEPGHHGPGQGLGALTTLTTPTTPTAPPGASRATPS